MTIVLAKRQFRLDLVMPYHSHSYKPMAKGAWSQPQRLQFRHGVLVWRVSGIGIQGLA
jgi:hypothetical protein